MSSIPTTPAARDAERFGTSARWLAKLRWVAAIGQLGTISVVTLLGVRLPIVPLLSLVAVTVLTNTAFACWRRGAARRPTPPRAWHVVMGGLMLLDLAVLTAMLWLTGGTTNPFVVFYFVNLALAAVLLPWQWSWVLCGGAVLAFSLLSWWHQSIEALREPGRLAPLSAPESTWLAAIGAIVAFGVSAGVIVNFATRLTGQLEQSEQARRDAEQRRARSEKLEALGTLAAGAAHELASPLSTIAVVARELELELQARGASEEVRHDAKLIRDELVRCRAILDRMSIDSGQAAGEAPTEITVAELAAGVVSGLPGAPVEVEIAAGSGGVCLTLPVIAVGQALRALAQNGLDASGGKPVGLAMTTDARTLTIEVQDHGPGIDRDVLRRIGEPFFTTKDPGKGMGLGVFLARSVIERLGGSIDYQSAPGEGARAVVRLPIG
ncbi:Sensor histidine kinase RegB [Pirellulimonas nuda]|uniref:histidine kinase n=1 Tax=Pirellulimonas nuda TaxID=2528009 RepID=A0A518DIG7_9BACT|nr:ATP-binding protein [Pirellulimonas nuda]QDU91281.1 Sensor histidine kinase RegB [Pirellulimonas nuda]